MAYPNYNDTIIDDALGLAGMNRQGYDALVQNQQRVTSYNPSLQGGQWGPGNPKPIGREDALQAGRLAQLNASEYQISGLAPYFQQARERDAIRQQEDLRKYQRDYRAQIMGSKNRMGQTISGTGARMTGIPTKPGFPQGPSGGAYSALPSAGISDPITQSYKALAAPVF